ncbi:unnamed protein product [Caenorhabditis sp. 36 PRJEB53466]|nr:unnamed protein product [Caenorhabditis sp. 36 PRJEB53466]
MKLLRVQKLTYLCNFSSSTQLFKKPSRLFKKKPQSKISLAPKFLENAQLWPKSLEAERKAQYEKLDELIAEKKSWRLIESRGLCVGNLLMVAMHNEVANGTVAILSGDSVNGVKWLKAGTPVTLNKLNEEEHLKTLSEGHVVESSNGTVKVCIYEDNNTDFSTSNYILMPSSNGGAIKYLQTILKNPASLSSDSVHLVNLAYRSIPMPSIHDKKVSNLPKTLNESQIAAVSAALNPQRNLLCIQGPPGTGKTRVIAEIVHHLTSRKKKVLVCAPTHVAVRNALEATARRMKEEDSDANKVAAKLAVLNNHKEEFQNHPMAQKLFQMYKELGKTSKSDASYNSRSYQCYIKRIEILKDIYRSTRAIFTTLGTSSIQKLPEYDWNADVMLVDEAAQCTEPATWVPVLTTPQCKKLVLVGDQKQLPAVVLSTKAQKDELNVSLMEKLTDEFSGSNINILLKEQYRMNEKIMRWSNEVFYENQLTAHPSVASITLNDVCPNVPKDHVLNNPIFMIDMDRNRERTHESFEGHSFTNLDETAVVRDYVERLVVDVGLDAKEIAVIAPYYAQIEKIREAIRFPIGVNTVDAFQGHERQVVIFCLVRDNKEGFIGFLNETRRLNVAITRAKRQFVLIGSGRMMQKNRHLKRLYKHLHDEKMIFGASVLNDCDEIELPQKSPF